MSGSGTAEGCGCNNCGSDNKTLKDWAVAADQPAVAALESPLDKKFAVHERIQKEGMQAIANAQKLSISNNGDGGDLGLGNNGTNGNGGDGPVQNTWVHKGVH